MSRIILAALAALALAVPAATAAPTREHASPSIAAIAAQTPQFSTLLSLVKLANDRAALRRVLLYHVVTGTVPAAKVVTLTSAKTLAGPSVKIRVTGKTVRVNTAKVTKADVKASNGIVHVIDRVLIPPAA